MNIGWPEGIYIGLAILAVASAAVNDGEPKTGLSARHSFPVTVTATALGFALLYWGGFFA